MLSSLCFPRRLSRTSSDPLAMLQLRILLLALAALVTQVAYAAETLISGNIDAGQIIIAVALAVIAWEARSLIKSVRSIDRRLMHMEEWAEARHDFKRRGDD